MYEFGNHEKAFSPAVAGGEERRLMEVPALSLQSELWFASSLSDEANQAYIVSITYDLDARISLEDFKRAVGSELGRWPLFCAEVFSEGAALGISGCIEPEWIVRPSDRQLLSVDSDLRAELFRPFEMTGGKMLRLGLWYAEDGRLRACLVSHQIVTSVRGLEFFLRSAIARLSNPSLANAEDVSPNTWWRNLPEFRSTKAQWIEPGYDCTDLARLPHLAGATAVRTYNAAVIATDSDAQLATLLEDIAICFGLALDDVVLGITAIWLHLLSRKNRVSLGIQAEVQHSQRSGPFHCLLSDWLPAFWDFSSLSTAADILELARTWKVRALSGSAPAFGDVLATVNNSWIPSEVPLIPVTIGFQDLLELPRTDMSLTAVIAQQVGFTPSELDLCFSRDEDGVRVKVTYNRDLFSADYLGHWMKAWHAIAEQIGRTPEIAVNQIALLDAHGYAANKSITDRTTGSGYPEKFLMSSIGQSCQAYAFLPAVICNERVLSYADLAAQVHGTVARLREVGACPGDVIAVCVSRSENIPGTIVGIWQAGAVYLPIDPMLPAVRRDHILRDSGVSIVISDAKTSALFDAENVTRIPIESLIEQELAESEQMPWHEPHADDLAYLIYTSGSTGLPKGVRVTHGNMVNFLNSMAKEPGFSSGQRLAAVTSLSFDISILELFLPLVVGGSVYMVEESVLTDGEALSQLLDFHEVDCLQATPATWRLLLAADWRPRKTFKALCGGEPLPPEVAVGLIAAGCELWNMYGPTETTVWSTCQRILADEQISVGLPIANTSIHILDERLVSLPPGIPGEICIGGQGVSEGYHGRDELTREKFCEIQAPDGQTVKVYRTGDLGYFAYDHRLYHLGRSDHQVKLRGYRIELQDIDANLLALDEIKRAVTELVQPPGGEPLLVAYLQSNDGNPLNTAALRRSLIAVLPSYMIPQRFVWIDEFPLTPNGKLDRQALREWEDSGAPDVNSYGPALSETEASLAEICQQLIGGRKLNRNDNFFAAGGHSLLALQAVAKIRERFGVSVPTRIITLEPLLEVARFIEDSSSKSATHSQVGLWSKIKGLVGLNK